MQTRLPGTEDSKVYCRKEGEGPVVLLLHGFPEDGELWNQVWPSLSTRYRVLIPDIPGAGKSPLETSRSSIEGMAETIHDLLLQEQSTEAVVVGHSMGGYLAMALAEKYPDMIKGLALVHSTATADTDEKKQTRQKSIDLIRKGGREPFIRQMVPNLFSPAFREANPELVEKQIEKGFKLSPESMISFYNAMINRPDRTLTLKNGVYPLQWIIGVDDKAVPAEVVLPQVTFARVNFVELYRKSAHMSMIEESGKLTSDLAGFIGYCYNQ